jgi:hypothetical protein
LWIGPLTGPPGFLEVTSPTDLEIHSVPTTGDPLYSLPAGQRVGLVVIDFAARRRLRINGVLTSADQRHLVVQVEQAFGNCPQYIQQRVLEPTNRDRADAAEPRRGTALLPQDVELIRGADTFFLGTSHPERGSDASHRGGAPGFVRIDGGRLWWPDYAGNNMFNSFGNLAVSPASALLFTDFTAGHVLHLSGTTEIDWVPPGRPGDDGGTGRRACFTLQQLVARDDLPARQTDHRAYPRNPAVTVTRG